MKIILISRLIEFGYLGNILAAYVKDDDVLKIWKLACHGGLYTLNFAKRKDEDLKDFLSHFSGGS